MMKPKITTCLLWALSLLGLAACSPLPTPGTPSAATATPASDASRSIAAHAQPMDALKTLTCEMPASYPQHCKRHWTIKHSLQIASAGLVNCDDRSDKTGCSKKVVVEKVVEIPPGSKDPITYCTAKFEYDRLTVPHKQGAASSATKVMWTISDPAGLGAEFESDPAPSGHGTGIALQGKTNSPSDVWETLVNETTASRVVMRVKAYTIYAQEFCHYPRVTAKGLGACCPGDPIIINQP